MHLSLPDLGRAVCLGKAFWSVFQRRRLQVEESLTLAGIAAFGKPFLERVGQVLQRYLARKDLATGCASLHRGQHIVIDKGGTVMPMQQYLGGRTVHSVGAEACLFPRPRTLDLLDSQNLDLVLWGGDGCCLCAQLTLQGPTRRSSDMHRNDRGVLHISPDPHVHTPGQPADGLGAMYILACQVAKGPTCQQGPESSQQAADANPAALPLSREGTPGEPRVNPGTPLGTPGPNPLLPPSSSGGNLGQAQDNPGTPLEAPEANPGNCPVVSQAAPIRPRRRRAL
jgi:hypothetical protein